ncbi:MAG: class I tRNA ligase family protein, partial [Gemmatimonadetes bacterium]|nr:class I tRNA ligase family protein [Gemmatimonadota bacterium]
ELVRSVLVTVLERSLRLLHPIMPFVTEELWRQLPEPLRAADSIMVADWPVPTGWSYPESVEAMALARAVISAARNLRAEYDVPPGREAPLVVAAEAPSARAALEHHAVDVARLSTASEARIAAVGTREDGMVSQVVRGGVEIGVRLADLVDVERERERLTGEIERAESILASTRRRLENDQFVSKAPAEVVRREREKAADLERSMERLEGLRDALPTG